MQRMSEMNAHNRLRRCCCQERVSFCLSMKLVEDLGDEMLTRTAQPEHPRRSLCLRPSEPRREEHTPKTSLAHKPFTLPIVHVFVFWHLLRDIKWSSFRVFSYLFACLTPPRESFALTPRQRLKMPAANGSEESRGNPGRRRAE